MNESNSVDAILSNNGKYFIAAKNVLNIKPSGQSSLDKFRQLSINNKDSQVFSISWSHFWGLGFHFSGLGIFKNSTSFA